MYETELAYIEALFFVKHLFTSSTSITYKERILNLPDLKIFHSDEALTSIPSTIGWYSPIKFEHLRIETCFPFSHTFEAGSNFKKYIHVKAPNSIVYVEFTTLQNDLSFTLVRVSETADLSQSKEEI